MSIAATDSLPSCPASRYPISRWYLHPLALRLAGVLAAAGIRPSQVTLVGVLFAAAAAAVLVGHPALAPVAGILVWVAWLCDRTDGLVARQQGSATAWGAWLDANVDELVDVGLHIALAAAIGTQAGWFLVIGFLAGKYLFMYGLSAEAARSAPAESAEPRSNLSCLVRRAYHLPGNADVRLHVLVAALVAGLLTTELLFVAVYYNLRWMARYVLVARRLGGDR